VNSSGQSVNEVVMSKKMCLLLLGPAPVLSLGVAVTLFSAPAAGEGTALLARARELVELLETLRLTRVTREREHRVRIDALEHQIERLRAEERIAEEERFAEEKALDEAFRRIQAVDAEAAALSASLSETRRALLDGVTRASGRIRAGFPHRSKEREEALDGVRAVASGQDFDALLRAFESYRSFFFEEIRRAREIELRREVVLHGERRGERAQVLRLGLVEEIWLAEDGSTARIVGPAGVSADLDPAEIELLRALFELKRGWRPPRLLAVPFVLRGSEDP